MIKDILEGTQCCRICDKPLIYQTEKLLGIHISCAQPEPSKIKIKAPSYGRKRIQRT